ncbi:hypothetical protein EOPP23_03075 [Endozoicomonas sp. OPT23]|uniref:hypothetical protein n=1 Tax=Endozoicomonas sp. OPT23 TaxID=2072845 RepID=UPI00129B9467|nr:hypothetical protein [Endozoicomonas sp. OPT23]MRI31980.1 hypothetical protein [Endozoicomonas sp. OPT23]
MKSFFVVFLMSLSLLTPLVSSASDTEFPFRKGSASGAIINAAERFTRYYSASDYHCGSVQVTLMPDWEVLGVLIINGSVQNQFQFRTCKDGEQYCAKEEYSVPVAVDQYISSQEYTAELEDLKLSEELAEKAEKLPARPQIYLPSKFNTNQLQVRQLTGFVALGNVYWNTNPVEFIVKIRHKNTGYTPQFYITQSVCSIAQKGEVGVEQLSGRSKVSYYIQNSERDDQTYFYHNTSTAFFTPGYVVIPSPAE